MASNSLSTALPPLEAPPVAVLPSGRAFFPFNFASSSSTALPDSNLKNRPYSVAQMGRKPFGPLRGEMGLLGATTEVDDLIKLQTWKLRQQLLEAILQIFTPSFSRQYFIYLPNKVWKPHNISLRQIKKNETD